MSLNGESRIVVNTTRDEGYDISFRFKTTIPSGLLAIGGGSTFYILELVKGRLNLHSSLLNKWEGVFIGSELNNSHWQKVNNYLFRKSCINFIKFFFLCLGFCGYKCFTFSTLCQ